MATQLFLRSVASDIAGAGSKSLSRTRGGASSTLVTNTATSGTSIPVTLTAGGTAVVFYSPRFKGIVVSGVLTINIRGLESSLSANATAGIKIEHCDKTGAVIDTMLAEQTIPTAATEYTTSDAAMAQASLAVTTSRTLADGDRIKVTLIVKNVGTMATAFTVTNTIDGPSAAAAGDTYVTFTETFTDYIDGTGSVAMHKMGLAGTGVEKNTGTGSVRLKKMTLAGLSPPDLVPPAPPVQPVSYWFTFDEFLRRDELIEDYISFVWTERYSAFGDFQIITKSTYNSRQQLTIDTWIGKNDSRVVMKIETILDDTAEDGSRILTVTGRSMESLLDDRVAMPAVAPTNTTPGWVISGKPADVIRSAFEQICVAGIIDPHDTIPFYVNGTISQPGNIPEPSDIITVTTSPDTLYNFIKQVADTYGIGFRLVRNEDLGQIYFEVYMGNDLTTGQDNVDPVIFDQNLDNLVKPSLLKSTAILKTVAYVFAQNGSAIVYAPNANPSDSGADRRVLLVNSNNDFPATRVAGFRTDSSAAHSCFLINPTLTTAVFGVPTSFVSSSNVTSNGVQDGLDTTPLLGYKSYAQFKADILNTTFVQAGITYNPHGPIDKSTYEWVGYDIEDWADTPDVEGADPEQYIGLFIQLAHDNGFKVMLTPARDLGNSATVHPKNVGETLNDWFVRVNVASWCAEADIFEFQNQANQPVEADFKNYFKLVYDQIKAVNPDIPVWCGISVTYGDGEVMFNSARFAWTLGADGLWVNVIGNTTDSLDFMTRWQAYAATLDTGLTAALQQEGLQALAKQRTVYSFDGELPPSTPYIYGVDYSLGDVVEERTEDRFKNQVVVIEQIFTSDDTGDRSYPTLALMQTITPGSWLAEPVTEHWDDVPESEHWDDL